MKIIGKGRTAVVYELSDNRVLKLYNKGIPRAELENEFYRNKHINELNINAPKTYEIVTHNSQLGIVFEKLTGNSLLNLLIQDPQSVENPGSLMAQAHIQMHLSTTTEFPELKEALVKCTNRLNLLENQKTRLIDYINCLPDGSVVCHLDYHPDNIIISDGEVKIIDWVNAYRGHPAADVCYTVITLTYGAVHPDVPVEIAAVINKMRSLLVSQYLDYYVQHSNLAIDVINEWKLPMLVFRYFYGAVEEREILFKDIIDLIAKL